MSIIACMDCGTRISDAAPSCLGCGRPQKAGVQTVELTGKKWKALQLWGGLFLILSPFVCVAGAKGQDGPGLMMGGMAMFALGAAVLLIGRIGAFWHHK